MVALWHALLAGLGQLMAIFFEIIPSYGIAVILLTILIRVVMLPLAIKQARSMEATRKHQSAIKKIQPELKKLREKHRDDRAKLYEETKKLQDEHGVNPMGGLMGCLPTLLQLPILFAMYRVISGCSSLIGPGRKCPPGKTIFPVGSAIAQAFDSGKAKFLTLSMTSTPEEVIKEHGGWGPGFIDVLPYLLLIAVMALTTLYQTKQMNKVMVVDPQMAQTQKIMMFLPLMFVFYSYKFPAGLTLYWTFSNIWTIGQQFVLFKKFPVGGRPQPQPKPDLNGKTKEIPPSELKRIEQQEPRVAKQPQGNKGGTKKRRKKKGRR